MNAKNLEGIEFRRLKTPEEVDEAGKLLATVYQDDESVTVCFDFAGDEWHNNYVKPLTMKMASEEYHLGAFDMNTGNLIGCLLSEDLVAEQMDLSGYLTKNMAAAFKLLGDTQKEILKEGLLPNEKGKVFHTFLLVVSKDFMKRGIGTELVRLAEDIARNNGFEYIYIQSTSPYSQRLATDSLKFNTLKVVPMPVLNEERAKKAGFTKSSIKFCCKKL